jgi:hypothetical protein
VAAVDGCGSDGVFAAAVTNDDRRHQLNPTTASVVKTAINTDDIDHHRSQQ